MVHHAQDRDFEPILATLRVLKPDRNFDRSIYLIDLIRTHARFHRRILPKPSNPCLQDQGFVLAGMAGLTATASVGTAFGLG